MSASFFFFLEDFEEGGIGPRVSAGLLDPGGGPIDPAQSLLKHELYIVIPTFDNLVQSSVRGINYLEDCGVLNIGTSKLIDLIGSAKALLQPN